MNKVNRYRSPFLLNDQFVVLASDYDRLEAENKALKAELAELKEQEPIGWWAQYCETPMRRMVQWGAKLPECATDKFYPFYAAPVARAGQVLDGAEQIAFVLRQIGCMDAEDISGDNVDLRFEDADGRDTGCDVSIVEYAEKAADLIEAMLAAAPQPAKEGESDED